MKKFGVCAISVLALSANMAFASGPQGAVSEGQVMPEQQDRGPPVVASGSLGSGMTTALIIAGVGVGAALILNDDDDDSSSTTTGQVD